MSGKILNHDSKSMIVSRITFLFDDFVICCYPVTKLFCSRYCFASASWFFSICRDFGLLGGEYKKLCLLDTTLVMKSP